MNKYSYVTVVTNNFYLQGALYLHYSLKKVNSKYPLLILITDNFKINKMLLNNINYKIVPYYHFPQKDSIPRYEDTINKFHIYDLIEYDKLLFLDSDLFILKNIDDIFEKTKQYNYVTMQCINYQKGLPTLTPWGAFFIFKPKKNLIKSLLTFEILNTYSTDEEILKNVIYPELLIKGKLTDKENIFSNLNLDYSTYYYHDSGKEKYWQLLNDFTPEQFCNFNDNIIFKFFGLWKDIKKSDNNIIKNDMLCETYLKQLR